MKRKSIFLMIGLVCAAFAPPQAFADNPVSLGESLTAELVSAIHDGDFSLYVSNGDANFKASIKPEQFRAVAARFAPRFKMGYDLTYFGELTQHGEHVFLCRLRFNDGGDDALCTLGMKRGRLDSFGIR